MPVERKNIWVAASDGDLERVKELIEAGIAPTIADENSYTPLHAAASWGRLEVLKYLHSQGGDINITDDEGDTPLFSVEDLQTAKLVIELGGDPKHQNNEGQTAAQTLAEDYPEVCNYLRSLVGEPPLEPSPDDSECEDDSALSLDPTNQMTKDLIDQVRDMMTDAEAKGIDTDSPELDLRLRELVSKTVDRSVGLGKLMAANRRDDIQPAAVTENLEVVAEGDETHGETNVNEEAESNKRQKT